MAAALRAGVDRVSLDLRLQRAAEEMFVGENLRDLMPSPGNPFPSARVIGPSVMSVLADIARQLEAEMAGLSSKDWSPVHDDLTSETGFS
jgi:hypothetical protein